MMALVLRGMIRAKITDATVSSIRPPDSGDWRPRFHERTDLMHGGLMKVVHCRRTWGRMGLHSRPSAAEDA